VTIKLSELDRLSEGMDIEPEQRRPVDYPFTRDDMDGGVWWYVTDTTGLRLVACAQEEHAEFLAASIVAMPALIAIAKAALDIERTKAAYLNSGWLSDENPLLSPYKDAIDAYYTVLREVSP
jgi:hypothetical protein